MIGSDYPVIVSGSFGCRECGRIVSSLDLCPKVIRRHPSSCCGLQIIDDDVLTKPLPRVEFEHFRDKLGVVRKDLS